MRDEKIEIDYKSVEILDFMWKYRNDSVKYGEGITKAISYEYIYEDKDIIGYDVSIVLTTNKHLHNKVFIHAKLDRNFSSDNIEVISAQYVPSIYKYDRKDIQLLEKEDILRMKKFIKHIFIEKYVKQTNYSKYKSIIKNVDGVKLSYNPIFIDKVLYKGYKKMSTIYDMFSRASQYGSIKEVDLVFSMNIGNGSIKRYIKSGPISIEDLYNKFRKAIADIRDTKYDLGLEEQVTIKEYYFRKGISLSNDQVEKILTSIVLDMENERNLNELDKIFKTTLDSYVNWRGNIIFTNNNYYSNCAYMYNIYWKFIPVTPKRVAKDDLIL